MAKAQKVVEVQDQVDLELLARSKKLLDGKGFNYAGLSEQVVIDTARLVCDIQGEMAIEKQQEQASKLEKILRKETKKDFESLIQGIMPLVKSEIGANPTKSYSSSIKTDNGTITVGVIAYQDTDKPDVRGKRTARQGVEKKLRDMIENHSLVGIEKMLKVKRGTKDKFSFGVYDKKVKVDKFDFQLTLGYEVLKEED